MAIQFELYKTPRPKDEEDKEVYHARVVNFQHIDTDYLAKEIQIATSLTEGDVKSVLESLSHFMGDRLREGQSVHLDGIGYFQIKLNSQEPITSPKLKANQIKLKANISFKADVKLKKSVSVVHVERSKLKPHSAVLSNDEIDKLLTNYFKSVFFILFMQFQRQSIRVMEESHLLAGIIIHTDRLTFNANFRQFSDRLLHAIHAERKMT